MRIRRIILLVLVLSVCACVYTYAQTDTIRYVSTSGSYNNDGLSWATPKNRLQDAINDLRDYMQINNLTSGSVYVAAGTYVPTESTESSGGSMLNTSFKIYSGIHVYGGFNPASPEASPGDRLMVNGKMAKDNWANQSGIGTTSGTEIASQWDLQYKTILSGNHSSTPVVFEFDSVRGRFNTTYPVSSYHVVWFATNGKIDSDDEATAGHYRPLDYPALVDGCVLTGGNASTRATSGHEHSAYGGGAYLVGNSQLRNCIVEKCNSTLRGGGVYLDGGGIVEFCYIHTCQSAGVGVVQGYGGGACIEYDGQVGHSHITNCAARCGGGLAICHIPSEYPLSGVSYYSPFSTACVINNNTASAEGGGIYLAEGGTINHATVTANNCIGPDVTYYGRRHGRSGGIYIRDCGMIFNSVFWGNRCATNNDMQFASVHQVADAVEHQVFAYHSAFMNHDITDWTGVQKEMVFSLEKRNLPVRGASGNYPCFFAPTVNPTNWDEPSLPGAGVFMHLDPEDYPGPRIWHLTSYSALDQKGVQVTDAVQDASEWIRHAHTDYGVVSNPYEPVSTLGALVRKPDPIAYSLVEPQGQEGRVGGAPIPTLFIDPNRKGVYDAYDQFQFADHEGNSWDTPIKDMGEALSYFRQFLRDDPGDSHHYWLPELDGSGNPTGDSVRYDYVQILMKEGTITTAGPGNYLDRNIRTAAMRVESHMRLYGGYPSSLTGTTTAGRNPRSAKSIITSNITGITGARGYENNSAHVIALVNAEHSIIDGFTLSDANTHNLALTGSVQAGGGVLVSNATTPASKRVNMVGNQLRNVVINNCTAPKGAAIYVNGEYPCGDGDITYAELLMVNCVVRNNKADYVTNGLGIVTEGHGVITANGRAYIHAEHCTVVNNVGYPFKADSKATDTNEPIYCLDPGHLTPFVLHGYIRVDNSIIFCNGDRVLDDRGQLGGVGRVTSVNGDGQEYVFGMYNMFDADLALHNTDPSQPHGFFQNGFTAPEAEHFLPVGVVSNYTSDISSLPTDSLARHNQCIFVRDDIADVNYPSFVNPARNVGNTPTGDRPLYGGIISYTPMTTNPCVNAAYINGYTATNNYDRSDVVTRDRGGAPDIGAIENEDLPAAGEIIYVTPDGAGKRDGSSWDNAIAGNTVYALNGAGAAAGDQLDTDNGTTRLINASSKTPVLTSDERYQGGFARCYLTSSTERETSTTVTDTWVSEVNIYSGGPRNGERELVQDRVLSETTETTIDNAGSPEVGFEQGWGTDVRYPYGEMSGASCYQWRSVDNFCPVPETWPKNQAFSSSKVYNGVRGIGSGSRENIIVDGNMRLQNERRENFVSGLQWAVEEASRRNHAATRRMGESFAHPVQVWVGAGKYTDYKGYVMRDSVTVLGGFPTTVYPAPGLSERQALMTATVNIPKPPQNVDLNAEDYETILQISDISPRLDSVTFNPAAVRFQDNDLARTVTTDTRSYAYRTRKITNTYVYIYGLYVRIDQAVVEADSAVAEPRATENIATHSYTISKARATLRKHVLQMPDVTQPTWSLSRLGAPETTDNNFSGNEPMELVAHTDRLDDDARAAKGTAADRAPIIDPNYKRYNAVVWDGFTIRHGFIHEYGMNHGGGAGVRLYEGASLKNCIITENYNDGRRAKGAGIFCDGASSTVSNCFVLGNTVLGASGNNQVYAGGLFLYHGTCFNSLFTRNLSKQRGGGVALCVGRFFNNTVVNNYIDSGSGEGGGIAISSANSTPSLFVANTIVYDNLKTAIYGDGTVLPFLNCYIQSRANISNANIINAINNGRNNIFLNKTYASAANNPFAKSYTVAERDNDFALKEGSGCVNKGEEDFVGALDAVLAGLPSGTVKTNTKTLRDDIEATHLSLPDNDVVYAKRIQDCQVDIGAYEFNAAYSIRPDTTTHPGTAIFYLSFASPGGDASSSAPWNAACAQKMQMVIDAAGRYKYSLMTAGLYDRGYTTVDGKRVPDEFTPAVPNKCWSVEVWFEGDETNSTTTDDYTSCYTPVRSTKYGTPGYTDNTLDYSLIVPHGIVMKGGFAEGFYHYEDVAGNVVDVSDPVEKHVVDDRDPLTYRTVLSGRVTSSTGAEGQCYHVVTFTDNLYDINERVIDDGGQLAFLSDEQDAEAQRVVLDGLFIEHGHANAPDPEDRIGAGAVVTGYAHIRNCVVQNNQAEDYGGGLYLQPNALVSGTIVKHNTADVGGGIYVEAPENNNPDTLAHIFSSTICQNTATSSAGGMWFDNTNARVNSSVLWNNTANDYANVSGIFSRTSSATDYPFVYCAVESRRVEGQGNVELPPTITEGVRWDDADPFSTLLYYPIEMSSMLARAGMTYMEWYNKCQQYTTLDSTDIAGVSRLRWRGDGSERGYAWGADTLVTKNNDFIEIGARALNKDFSINVDPRYVMRRLFVMHSELLNSDAARALQNNPNTDDVSNMYRQMGSCILNPFHRLGDAFDYIIAARKARPELYRNARFEVYVEQGTYYPYHNAYGEQDQVRNNTFLIPEATTVVGGINSRAEGHNYCQAGYIDPYTNTIVGDGSDVAIPGTAYTLDYALADSIRRRDARHRPMRDINLNSVIEPWELERQTILSGNTVSDELFTHSYHVITIHADSTKIGPQPYKYRDENESANWRLGEHILTNPIAMNDVEHFNQECERSLTARAVVLDGIFVTGGSANHFDSIDAVRHAYQKKTYFRGGGILVDGFWTQSFDEDDGEVPFVTTPSQYNIPLVLRHCQFQDNMAANGGAIWTNGDIHVYSSHFTQNYSQGPMTKVDQKYIPWAAGGAIATNSYCGIVNTLFDNNEARRGLYPITISGAEAIPDVDARQGFGGVLSVSQHSLLRAVNCHFMRNKAVAYSAVYNHLANNRYRSNRDSIQTVFNSIFWGNEVFDVDNLGELEHIESPTFATMDAFNRKYKASRAGVFHYDGDAWDKYERLFHQYDSLYHHYVALEDTFNTKVTDKLAELRQQGDSVEGLFYCSYRKTYGPSGMCSNRDGYLLTEAEYRDFVDARALPVPIKVDPLTGDIVGDYTQGFTSLHGNNNVLINRDNNASDGPNFKQPSMVAGVDGYMQNADWISARINLTVDKGWGHLKQSVTRGISHYITTFTGDTHYATEGEAWNAIKDIPGATVEDVMPIHGSPVASFDVPQPAIPALYNYLSYRASRLHNDYSTPPLPCGEDVYMTHTSAPELGSFAADMLRISKNPRMNIEDAYIDMGVYEYQYIQLNLDGNEVDTVWVATVEKDPMHHDGLSWETPTTDLQAAIDLVMSSYNNRDKYICLMGDASNALTPSLTIDNRLAFVVTSNSLSPLLPDTAVADEDYKVKSLTFLGGYSFDAKGVRDPLANPSVIEMPNVGGHNQLNQLFVIEDMTRENAQANWLGEFRSRDNQVIPVTFDGITFINPYSTKDASVDAMGNAGGIQNQKGGAAIYYRWQHVYENHDGVFNPNFNYALYPDSALVDNHNRALPKLTLSNCIFMDNGQRTANIAERSPAVRIDHGGGSSLIVNSLFHSNAGAPVFSTDYDVVVGDNNLAEVPNDVVIVNSTFALNDGHVTLESAGSEMHNSLVWLDDLANDTTVQLEIHGTQWDKAANRNRIGVADRVTHNAIWGCFQSGDNTYKNDPLVTENMNIFQGPYFVDPKINAANAEQRRQRDFRINPGVRTMNLADTVLYRNRVLSRLYPDKTVAVENFWWRRPLGFKSDTIYSLTSDYDLAHTTRLSGTGMERGAYECQAVVQRIIYVRSNLLPAFAGDGSSWDKAFGQGQLQNAIDVASVYTFFNSLAPDPNSRRSYVFVKGSYDADDHVDIIARDGVNVFGSIPNSYNDTAWLSDDEYTNDECRRYLNLTRSVNNGVASPSTTPSHINSITAVGDYTTGFLMDGFVISNPGVVLDASPVVLNAHATLRNCIITDNHVEGAPVVDMNRGLIYNSLLYNDTASTLVKAGSAGLLLNNTIVASREGDVPVDDTEAEADNLINNIAYNESAGAAPFFAPYLTTRNPYTLPAYLTQYPALGYQLHEHSRFINDGSEVLPSSYNRYVEDRLVNFALDRDILGNPRRVGGRVDKGAFETWRIEPNQVFEITSLTNVLNDEASIAAATPVQMQNAFTNNYGGNRYPHSGSVVYLMDSSALTMAYDDGNDFHGIVFRPGFMLMKPGASFYGNGHQAQMNYLAVEKRLHGQQFAMNAFPFDYYADNITTSSYNSATDALTCQLSGIGFDTYQYNGVARSAKDYTFRTDNSALWQRVDTAHRVATEGYLVDFRTAQDTLLRYNAFAPAYGRYVYSEMGDDKIVALRQHDSHVAGSGAALNFTRQEDMGWNMKGLPWLVSGYRTDTLVEEDNYLRQMYIPHVFYYMGGDGDYLHMTSPDRIYAARSWDPGTTLTMGDAFLTQTATMSDHEDVIFHLPYYTFNEPAARPIVRVSRRKDNTGDFVTVIPDSAASTRIEYRYGRDGVKWSGSDTLTAAYIMDNGRSSRVSLLGSAPLDTDIPLGINAPDADTYTFSLPDMAAFADYRYVWLIDYDRHSYTNLLNEDYSVELPEGHHDGRFALRIGGYPINGKDGQRQYTIFVLDGTLHVHGLLKGDHVSVFSPSGQLITQAYSAGASFTTPLPIVSGYVVKVNDHTQKVIR